MLKLKMIALLVAVVVLMPAIGRAGEDAGFPSDGIEGLEQLNQKHSVRTDRLKAALGASPDSALVSKDDGSRRNLEKTLALGRHEINLRDIVNQNRQTLDKIDMARTIPDLMMANVVKRRMESSQLMNRFFAQLNPGANSPEPINQDGLGPMCSHNLKLNKLEEDREMTDMPAFRNFARTMKRNSAQNREDDEKELASVLQKLATHFKSNVRDRDPLKDLEEPSDMPEPDNRVAARIRRLEQVIAQQEDAKEDGRLQLAEYTFGKLRPQLAALKKGDEELGQVTAQLRNELQGFLKGVRRSANHVVAQLKVNCEAQVKANQKKLMTEAYQALVMYHRGDANRYANTTWAGLANNMVKDKCDSEVNAAKSAVSRLLSPKSDLGRAIEQIGAIDDPTQVPEALTAVTNKLGKNLGALNESFDPMLQACARKEQDEQKITEFVQNLQGATQQDQQQLALQQQEEQKTRQSDIRNNPMFMSGMGGMVPPMLPGSPSPSSSYSHSGGQPTNGYNPGSTY